MQARSGSSFGESDLQRGLDVGEFVPVYQPMVELATGEIRYVEALVRWDHRALGRLGPAEFLDDEEDPTALVRLGWSVLIEASRRGVEWRLMRPDPPIRVTVNVAAAQLASRQLAARVEHLLDADVGGPPVLALEIGEAILRSQRPRYRDRLPALRNLGVEIVVDDFGVVASASDGTPDELLCETLELLESFSRFPVDLIKLAPGLVTRLSTGSGRPEFVGEVVAAAHAAGLRVVALAVERDADVARARELGFDLAQGFALHHPEPPDAIGRLLGAG